MYEAAEDISCNIMPQPLPAPCNPPPSPKSPLLYPKRTQTWETWDLSFSHDNIFFFCWKEKKACRPCCCGQPCGCMRKETCGYRLHKWPAWMCESQTKYRIWAAAVAEKAFSCVCDVGTCAFCWWMRETVIWWKRTDDTGLLCLNISVLLGQKEKLM